MVADTATLCKAALHGLTVLDFTGMDAPIRGMYDREAAGDKDNISSLLPGALFRPPSIEPDQGEQCLFDNGPTSTDVEQGRIGDCYFLAACAYIARRCPDILTKAIVPTEKPLTWRVRLYDAGKKSYVSCIVNHRLPHHKKTGVPLYARSKTRSELWVSLLEKGFAKLCGSRRKPGYKRIEGGWSSSGMMMLAGPGKVYMVSQSDLVARLLHDSTTMGKLCGALRALMAAGCGLFVSWREDVVAGRQDLVLGHAYSILDVRTVGRSVFFLVHNPWGTFEWTGDCSDDDTSVHAQQVRAAFGVATADDGHFIMPACELLSRMESLEVYEPEESTLFADAVAGNVVSWQDAQESPDDFRKAAQMINQLMRVAMAQPKKNL